MDKLFTIIGKLYVELHNKETVIQQLQDFLRDREQRIADLQSTIIKLQPQSNAQDITGGTA
jgi:glycine cleavage system regulatory protein